VNKPASRKNPGKCDPVRAAALESLLLIDQGESADSATRLVRRNKSFNPLDIRFLLQLVNGTTKMRRRLDHEIKFYLARPSVPLSHKLSNILRLGFYQLLYTDRVPDAAAVSESVNLARVFTDNAQSRLVNAVMRTRLRQPEKVTFVSKESDPQKHLADYYSYPEHFVRYCLDEFGVRRTEHLLENYNRPPSVCYRVNYLKAKPEEVCALLEQNDIAFAQGKELPEFIRLEKSGLPLESELLQTGKVYVQDESSGYPVRLLNPQPGMDIVDLTAAPGGKATHAAIRMRNKGRVTAVDKSRQRLQLVVENSQRLGIKIISPVASDVLAFKGGPFDRVLLDPPCSGWGTVRKHADLRWNKTPQDVKSLARVQTMMIDRAARLVKPGGVLVYSTCTILREENDQIVEEFLLRNKDFCIDDAREYFSDELVSERGFVKTYPGFDKLDGSFCARLRRKLA